MGHIAHLTDQQLQNNMPPFSMGGGDKNCKSNDKYISLAQVDKKIKRVHSTLYHCTLLILQMHLTCTHPTANLQNEN